MATTIASTTLQITSPNAHAKQQFPTNLCSLHHPTLHHHHHHCNLRLHHATTCSYKVSIQLKGQTTELEVDPNETIPENALETGLSVPHDCKLRVCMNYPTKLLRGSVDQSEGMLNEDVIERGYSLLCVSYLKSDCHIKIIPEELLSLQLATIDD